MDIQESTEPVTSEGYALPIVKMMLVCSNARRTMRMKDIDADHINDYGQICGGYSGNSCACAYSPIKITMPSKLISGIRT